MGHKISRVSEVPYPRVPYLQKPHVPSDRHFLGFFEYPLVLLHALQLEYIMYSYLQFNQASLYCIIISHKHSNHTGAYL